MSWLPERSRIRLLSLLLFLVLVFCGYAHGLAEEPIPPWKFAVISDTQGSRKTDSQKPYINEKVLEVIALDIVQEKPDFVLVAGDLVSGWLHSGGVDYPAQFTAWKMVMKPVYEAGIRVYPVRGNHEDGPERFALPPLPAHLEPPAGTQAALKDAFRKAFNQPYIPQNGPPGEEGLTYSFSHKNALVIGIDDFAVHQHKVNQIWFANRIASKTEAHLFVFGHEAAFGVGHKDNLSFFPQDRDRFWDAIGKGDGKVYFCGHDHMYNRSAIADSTGNMIRQIVSGTGGGSLRTWSGQYPDGPRVKGEYDKSGLHGYVLVTVDGSTATMRWKAIPDDGKGNVWQIPDSFSYRLSEATDQEKQAGGLRGR